MRARATVPTIKPWILPTGNAFIKDAARRHTRPDGNPGGDVDLRAALTSTIDPGGASICRTTGRSRAVPQPADRHGRGMGRLPSSGVAWYRKKLEHSGRRCRASPMFLDVDGAMSYAMVWLNGRIVGGWPFGYASWRVDLTPYIVPGGRKSAGDPARQSAGLLSLVSRRRDLPQRLADEDAAGSRRPVGHVRHGTRNVSAASATIELRCHDRQRLDARADGQRRHARSTRLNADGQRAGDAVAAVRAARTSRCAAVESARLSGSVTIDSAAVVGAAPDSDAEPLRGRDDGLAAEGELIDRYDDAVSAFGISRFDPEAGCPRQRRTHRHPGRQPAPRPRRARRGVQHPRGRAAAGDPARDGLQRRSAWPTTRPLPSCST